MTTFKMSPLKALFLMAILVFAHSSIAVAEAIESDDLEDIIDQDLQLVLQKAKSIALPSIAENGQFYPFGLIMNQQREIYVVGYSSDPKKAPHPDQFSRDLLTNISDKILFDDDISAAGLVRLMQLPGKKDGEDELISGMAILLDHRLGSAKLVFVPFLEGDSGKHNVGKAILLPTRDYFFVRDTKPKE